MQSAHKPELDDEEDIDDLDGLPCLETGGWLPSAGFLILRFFREAFTNALAAAALCFVMYDDMSAATIPVRVSSSSSTGRSVRSCLYFL